MYLPAALLAGSDRAVYAPHLDGTLPGDYGFDPLSLSATPESLDRNQELELLHARWAMLGVVGAVVPELLTDIGALPLAEPVWWKVGAAKLSGESLNYLGVGGFVIAGKQGVAVIAACQAVLMGRDDPPLTPPQSMSRAAAFTPLVFQSRLSSHDLCPTDRIHTTRAYNMYVLHTSVSRAHNLFEVEE